MNPNAEFERLRMRVVRVPAWQMILIGAASLAVLAALAVVATGVFLIVFPLAVVGGWIYRLTRKKPAPAASYDRPAAHRERITVIDGEYEVVEADRGPPRRD